MINAIISHLLVKVTSQTDTLPTSTAGDAANVMQEMDVFGLITSLLFVLALIFVSAFLLKRFNFAQTRQGNIKVIATTALGTKERLVVVEVNGEQLLLGVTAQQITKLDKLSTPIKTEPLVTPEFSQSIARFLKKQP